MPRYSVQQHHQLLHNLKETSLLTCTLDMLDMTGGAAVRLKYTCMFNKLIHVYNCNVMSMTHDIVVFALTSLILVRCVDGLSGSGTVSRPGTSPANSRGPRAVLVSPPTAPPSV